MKQIIILTLLLMVNAVQAKTNHLKLFSYRPANIWEEAYPIGNSIMGGMIYGGIEKEEIQINEETFWAGGPYNNYSPNALKALPEIKSLIFNNETEKAQSLINSTFYTDKNGMPYQSVGSVIINFDGYDNVDKYYRELDIERAVSTVKFQADGINYTRETFASLTDSCIIMKITADKNNSIDLSVSYKSEINNKSIKAFKDKLILQGKGSDHEGVKGKIKVQAITKIIADGGEIKPENDLIKVSKANEVTIYITAATNYLKYNNTSGNQAKKASIRLKKALDISYDTAKERHINYYSELFNRLYIDLGNDKNVNIETADRIEKFTENKDYGLISLIFQYGRYLLISSSQPGGQPTNLQGIWNNLMKAPWDSKYTININTEMNYWPAEVTNLPETHFPLVEMVKDLSVTGRETAKKMYDANGWVTHHNTDLWRATGPVDGAFYGTWPHGGGWLSTHLWEKYLYSGDMDYLEKVYPALKGAADFYLDYLTEHPKYGWLVAVPSMSPEHGPGGEYREKAASITAGCTMDNQISFDVLTNAYRATILLNKSEEYANKLKAAIDKLPPMQVGKYNQLQEWLEDLDNPNSKHRHISHAYGLFPGKQISPYEQPLLFEAIKTTMNQRGDEATGWSMGWKINIWARLLDGNRTFKIIKNYIRILPSDLVKDKYPNGRTYPNLFCAHPPFQIDGNFGFTAGIAEMLMQSHDNAIHLLPALPDELNRGEIKGLVARGGFVVDIKWENNCITSAKIESKLGGNLRIRSYYPLKGEGLKKAVGENTNQYFWRYDSKKPLVSKSINPKYPNIREVFEYDIMTKPGKIYYMEYAY